MAYDEARRAGSGALWATATWGGTLATGVLTPKLLPHPLAYTAAAGTTASCRTSSLTSKKMWKEGTLPRVIVATPDADRSFYMDRKDGAQKWKMAFLGTFVDDLRDCHPALK